MAAALIACTLSLLSKASGIVLPIVLLILDIYPLRRLEGGPGKWFSSAGRRVWWEKAPFLLLAVAFGLIALLAQREAGALKTMENYDITSRLAQVLFGIAFYLWKTLVPLGLSPLYELPTHLDPWDGSFIFSGLVVLAVSVGLFVVRRRWPAGLAIWVCYVVLLAPVLGTAQSGPQLVADRYTYLSCLGWALLVGASLLYYWQLRASSDMRSGLFILSAGLASVVLAALGVLTWKQTQVWHDSERLWRHAVVVSPGSGTVHYNLALVLRKGGELEEAIEHYRRSLEINPAAPDAHNNLGQLLAQRGELEEAIEHYRQALQINPAYAVAYNNLGSALFERGRVGEAIEQFRQSLKINPSNPDTHYNLAKVLSHRGDQEEAIQHYRQALQVNPADAQAHNELGTLLARLGRLDEAMGHFQKALTIQPDLVEAIHNLGRAEASQGQLDQAIGHFRQALRIQPQFAEAHESLARALALQGKKDEAMKHYQEALRILKSRRTGPGPSN